MLDRWRRVQKSREERRLKLVDWERRAEINTRKLEEKERRRAEEKELQPSGDDDGSEDSDDFIVSDDSHEDGYDAGDEPVAADEMSKNIFETGEAAPLLDIEPICGSILQHAPLVLHVQHLTLRSFSGRHAAVLLPVFQGKGT